MTDQNEKTRSIPTHIVKEFFRYAIVGGIAFIVDFLVLYVSKEFILSALPKAIYLATALGFLAGLLWNYLMCLKYVFRSASGSTLGRSRRDLFVFSIIGVIGLALTEIGMYVGVDLLSFHYLIVKCFVTGIVLIWNYAARKRLVFS